MLIAPTEPAPLKAIGTVNLLPERFGVDILFSSRGRWFGIQRKEISDLINSIHDGRLQREIAQMQGRLEIAVLIVEGSVKWTLDGELVGNGWGKGWTRRQHRGLLWSVESKGVWTAQTGTVRETIDWVQDFELWCGKDRHHSLERRPGPSGMWGKPDHREYGCHLLMGLPGVGPELANRIYEHFGGVPWEWRVGMEELMEVQGIGKKKAEEILGAL